MNLFVAFAALERQAASGGGQKDRKDIVRWLAKLRRDGPPYVVRFKVRTLYPELEQIVLARYSATEAVQRAIETRKERDERFAEALYFALGLVRDPRTINWLRSRSESADRKYIVRDWLGGWHHTTVRPRGWQWLEGKERWRPFLIDVFRWRGGEDLAPLFMYLAWGAHDKALLDYTTRILAGNLPAEEFIRVAMELHANGGRVPRDRLRRACRALMTTSADRLSLAISAASLPNAESLLPFMIEVLKESDSVERRHLEWRLCRLTFAHGIAGPVAWRKWYRAHGGQKRTDWLEASIGSLTRGLPGTVSELGTILEKTAVHWSGEPLLIKYIDKWSRFPELHRQMVPLFHCVPSKHRPKVQAAVARIMAQSADQTCAWGEPVRTVLRDDGYIRDPNDTWADFIRHVFSHP